MRHPVLAELVAEAGRALHGDEWGRPLAQELGVNERTVQRIAKAARERAGYRSIGRGLLLDLAALLAARAAALKRVEARIRAAAAVLPEQPTSAPTAPPEQPPSAPLEAPPEAQD